MKIIVVGGAGFIGRHLTAALIDRGHRVVVIDTRPPRQNLDFVRLHLAGQILPQELFTDVDAMVNLAGRDIFTRWNDRVRKAIYDSRILSTRSLVSSIEKLNPRPKTLVTASAVGYYGNRGEAELDESAAPGDDFLAKVCIDWEGEARRAETLGLRTVQVRTAPVLGRGGFLSRMVPIYRWGLGGPLGNGRQWWPWIHMQDIVGIYVSSIENEAFNGPVNSCSPGRVRNKEFSDILARILKRPSFIRVPSWAVKIVLNGPADFIQASQKVIPVKLAKLGYRFLLPDLSEALRDALGRQGS